MVPTGQNEDLQLRHIFGLLECKCFGLRKRRCSAFHVRAISLKLEKEDSMSSCMDIKMWPPALYLSPGSHLAVTQQGICSRFRAMQTSSNITALPTSTASLGGCKGSHMPFPKLFPKYIFNKAAARVFCLFFSVQLCLMNKTEKSGSNSLLI